MRLTLLSTIGLSVCLAAGAAAQQKPAPTAITGGTAQLYIGTYKGEIQIFDETTEKMVDRIPLKTGIPRSMTISPDKTRFYVMDSTYEQIEVVDIAGRKTVDTFTLSEGPTKTRIRSLRPDPKHRYVLLVARDYTKKIDRWDIGAPTIQVYDLAQRKVTKTIAWPQGDERENADLRISPDGKFLYFFSEDVLIYETENFTKVDEWALSQPIEPGMGRVQGGGGDEVYDEPGTYTGLFTMQDPVQNRRLMGIGRIDLNARKVDFTPVGPATGMQFAIAPDRKRGYALQSDIGRYDFWTFDLENKKMLSRQEFKGRPRMGLRVSSNGRLIYVYVAGATIDVYEANGFRYLRTIQMNADQTTNLIVLPSKAPPAAGR
jgi:hypothetical protein